MEQNKSQGDEGSPTPETKPNAAKLALEAATVSLTKDAIKAMKDVKIERVDVPEWGGFVFVKTMTGPERDRWELANVAGKGKLKKFSFENVRAITAAHTICDKDGKLLFTPEEVVILEQRSGVALNRVWEKASKLNGLTSEEIDELVGNSKDGHSDVSS